MFSTSSVLVNTPITILYALLYVNITLSLALKQLTQIQQLACILVCDCSSVSVTITIMHVDGMTHPADGPVRFWVSRSTKAVIWYET